LAQGFIERSLDRHLGSGEKYNFKSGTTEYFTCQVVDRINSQLMEYRVSFLSIHKLFASSNSTSEPVFVYFAEKVIEIVIHWTILLKVASKLIHFCKL
jgi:hypothetical protein